MSTAVPVQAGAAVSQFRRAFGYGLVGATLLLIWWGGQVKSHEAGLSVPDWPLSYGQLWPSVPGVGLPGNVFWEHWHRTIAAGIGALTMILAAWTALVEVRQWVRHLAWLCLGAVVVQGVLGGITVIFYLPPAVSITHAALAQTFLCLVAWLAYAGSREWLDGPPLTGALIPADDALSPPRRAALSAAQWATGAVFTQLILGALVRHFEAGLAVPFFPLSPSGGLVPEFVDAGVVLHLLHRGFAFVVAWLVIRAALRVARQWPHAAGHGLLLAGLVVGQIFLGATVIWFGKAPAVTSLHVAAGAGMLVGCWLLVLRCWRAAHQPREQRT